MKINRRNILKLGLSSLFATCLSPLALAQSSNPGSSSVAASPAPKLEGTVSYNAGWVVPLEDKAPLLELEAKKNKEREDLNKQKSGSKSDVTADAKEKPKSLSDKAQNLLTKIKNFF